MHLKHLLLASCVVSGAAFAEAFVIQDIQVEGLTRIDVGTVYNDLPVRVGELFDLSESPTVLRALYRSGFFSDIQLFRRGNTLVVQVTERPTIGSIEITGNEAIETDALREALESVGIAEGMTYVPALLARMKQELEAQYFSQGQYSVEVNTAVEDLPRNRVSISINLVEGEAARIRSINIIGNKDFSQKELRKIFTSTTPDLFSWFTKTDQYSKDKLAGDLEALRTFYLDRGYLKFEIESTQIAISDNKEDIYVTINIKEGAQYKVKDIVLAGNLIVPEEELKKFVRLKPGDLFSRQILNRIQASIVERLGNDGYAFAKVEPVYDMDDTDHTVLITLYVEPGSRVYVRHINFAGHYVSSDEILRREMTQMEGSLYSSEQIRRSHNDLYLLGYFNNIDIKKTPVAGTENEIDLDISVEEQSSGQLTGGLGYSQLDGLLFNAGLTQKNFLGTGNMVDLLFNRSESFISYRAAYNNPFYTVDGVSRGFDVFYQKTNFDKEEDISNYARDVFGGGMTYGIPMSPVDRLSLGIGYEDTLLKISGNSATVSEQIQSFVEQEGEHFNAYRLTGGWSHNTLDRSVFPTRGILNNLSASVTVPPSTLDYYKASASSRWFYPVYGRSVFSLRGSIAYGGGYGNTDALPFYENYFAGGLGSVRGFLGNTIGPLDSLGAATGGNFRVLAGPELFFPVPFVDPDAVRFSLFFDAGTVYNTEVEPVDLDLIRYSAGVSLQWLSPISPLVFSLAKPLKMEPTDREEIFQFSIGSML